MEDLSSSHGYSGAETLHLSSSGPPPCYHSSQMIPPSQNEVDKRDGRISELQNKLEALSDLNVSLQNKLSSSRPQLEKKRSPSINRSFSKASHTSSEEASGLKVTTSEFSLECGDIDTRLVMEGQAIYKAVLKEMRRASSRGIKLTSKKIALVQFFESERIAQKEQFDLLRAKRQLDFNDSPPPIDPEYIQKLEKFSVQIADCMDVTASPSGDFDLDEIVAKTMSSA